MRETWLDRTLEELYGPHRHEVVERERGTIDLILLEWPTPPEQEHLSYLQRAQGALKAASYHERMNPWTFQPAQLELNLRGRR